MVELLFTKTKKHQHKNQFVNNYLNLSYFLS